MRDSSLSSSTSSIEITTVGLDRLDTIRRLNVAIFDEQRIINTFDREDIRAYIAWVQTKAVGFKLGYRLSETAFYSAKGGVLPGFRRRGIARALLHVMMDDVRAAGYERFVYDTFPNKHPGMTVLGLEEGFHVRKAGYSPQYQDYRLRFEKDL